MLSHLADCLNISDRLIGRFVRVRSVSKREQDGLLGQLVREPWNEDPQAYEIPRWVPCMGDSSRDRPEVTPNPQVAATKAADL